MKMPVWRRVGNQNRASTAVDFTFSVADGWVLATSRPPGLTRYVDRAKAT